MPLEVPATVSPNQFYLIASARSIDANSLATTTLTWAAFMSAANTIPLIARLYRKTGTVSLLVGTLALNGTTIQSIPALTSTLLGAAADPLNLLLSTNTSASIVPISGNWAFTVGTVNGTPSTVDVEVWGFKTP